MAEREKRFYVNGEWLTEAQIPEIFNLGNVYADFRLTVNKVGLEEAKKLFRPLLKKQLTSFAGEVKRHTITPQYLYKLNILENGRIEVIDDDYPQTPNIVDRANPYLWYGLDETAGKDALYTKATFAQIFIDRYLLEYEQIKSLVEKHLATDPLLSFPFIQHLAEMTQTLSLVDPNGNTIEGFTSDWYATGMPATKVHKGGGSYYNIYRIVAVPTDDNHFNYFVQKQGYFHKLSWRRQVQKLLNLDQHDRFTPENEAEFMMRIIRLNPRRNISDPSEVLAQIGEAAGDRKIRKKIALAQESQQKLIQTIYHSQEAILDVFGYEIKQHGSIKQMKNLKYFFEAFGNAIFFDQNIDPAEVVKSYYQTLAAGKSRDAYIKALLPSLPTILQRVTGTFFCGSLSAGGLNASANVLNTPHGYGGLDKCLTCPACGKEGVTGSKCTCGFGRGMSLAAFTKQQKAQRANALAKSYRPKNNTRNLPSASIPAIKLFASDIKGKMLPASKAFSRQTDSVSVTQGLNFFRRAT